jgi:hypothetical protein
MTAERPGNAPEPSFWSLGTVAAVLGVSDLTLTALACYAVQTFLQPPNPVADLAVIADAFLTTFPLTVTVAILVAAYRAGNLSPLLALGAVIGTGLAANALHLGAAALQQKGIEFPPKPPPPDPQGGSGWILRYAFMFLAIYWEGYGPLLFLKSCLLGYAAGRRL